MVGGPIGTRYVGCYTRWVFPAIGCRTGAVGAEQGDP
jgi:hypothetical protein